MDNGVDLLKSYIEAGEFHASMEALTIEEAKEIVSSIEENTFLTEKEVLALLTLQG